MKLWLKSDPSITAETLRDEPVNGYLPAKCLCPGEDPETLYAVINPEEWSTEEICPAPPSVPETGWLVLYGEDPMIVKYLFVERERDAIIAINTRSDSFGYVPISIQRNAMIPPSIVVPDTVVT